MDAGYQMPDKNLRQLLAKTNNTDDSLDLSSLREVLRSNATKQSVHNKELSYF